MDPSTSSRIIAFSPQPSVADLLKRVLEAAGFAASAVWSTPGELEAEVRRARPDAIVYEVGVPFVEQWGRLQEARARAVLRNVPIVIATAAPSDQYRRVGVLDALEIFTRPSDPIRVRATIRAAIESSSSPIESSSPHRAA